MMNKLLIAVGIVAAVAAGAAIISKVLNKREEADPEYTDKNTDRVLGREATFYERYVKRALDVSVAFVGVVI